MGISGEELGAQLKGWAAGLGEEPTAAEQAGADAVNEAIIRAGVEETRGTVSGRLGDIAVTALDAAGRAIHKITE